MEKISCGGFYLGDNLSIENVDGKEILNSEGLPKVTASDNGKILGVVDGAWGKTDAPSGGGDFIIEGTASMVESPAPTLLIEDLSKTYAETKAAYLSGKTVKVKIDMSNMVFFSNAIGYQSFDGAEAIQFDGSAFQSTGGEFGKDASFISFALPED